MEAFVMIPYKEAYSEIYERGIRPPLVAASLKVVRADERWYAGPAMEKVVGLIRAAKLCVAELTEANPNIMYEVALAHAAKIPVVFLTQGRAEDVPFDIRHHRVISYSADQAGIEALHRALRDALQETLQFQESPLSLLKRMLVPASLQTTGKQFVVAASPLSYREAFRSRGGWKERPLGTYADHLGIRNLMQAFGLIFGLDRLPELLDPDDFHDEALRTSAHFYSIASPKANHLSGSLMKDFFENRVPRWDFRPDPESDSLRNPKLLLRTSNKVYEPVNKRACGRLVWDFGIVLRAPLPRDPSCMFMVLAGRSSRGTEASCLAATAPACLRRLITRLEEEGVDVDNHHHGFCAVVSIAARERKAGAGPDPSMGADEGTFRVEDVSVYVEGVRAV